MSLIRPLPERTGYAKTYWEGVDKDQLLIQRCCVCKEYQHYGRPLCVKCGKRNLEWVEASGIGTIMSYTTVCRTPFRDLKTPYVVALVKLEEGPIMLSHIIGSEPDEIRCDQDVFLTFTSLRDGIQLPVFKLER